jgi:hypothetical protein
MESSRFFSGWSVHNLPGLVMTGGMTFMTGSSIIVNTTERTQDGTSFNAMESMPKAIRNEFQLI